MIYIHIPFCKQACSYCDFYFTTRQSLRDDFVSALVKEIELQKNFFGSPAIIETIYLGGGTPSLLTANQLDTIFSSLHKNFTISSEAEITLEANPDDINIENLIIWKNTGINRLSIGLQSFTESQLQFMHRAHNSKQALQAVPSAQAQGFNNISIDLIYALPGLTNSEWLQTLVTAVNQGITHISPYALTVEERTRLAKDIARGKSSPPSEDSFVEHFDIMVNYLTSKGFIHYEISNFAKPGYQSKHNSKYWQNKPYLGLGPSAHGYDGINRFHNTPNVTTYISSLTENQLSRTIENLTQIDIMNEFIMTRLRLNTGLPIDEFNQSFGANFLSQKKTILDSILNQGLVILESNNLQLTNIGKHQADGLAASLFYE